MFHLQNIANKIITKCKEPKFAKGISTLVGASLINFLVGAIYSLCTLSVYEISYIKGIGGSISIEHLTFYYPVEVFFQCISAFVSGTIYKKIGLHKTNFIGVSILCFGYLIMYLSKNLISDILAMIFGGIGTGIILYPSTTNSYQWFKEHNGIIVGIMETMISLGSFFFAFIGEKIINKEEIPSNNEDNLYDITIGERIKIYLIFQITSLISVFFLSLILMHEKDKKEDDKEVNSLNDSKENQITNPEIKNQDNEKETLEQENKEKESNINNNAQNKENIPSKKINEEIIPIKVDSPERLIKFILTKNTFGHKSNKDNKYKEKYNKKILLAALKSNRLILFSIIVILEAPVSNMAFTLYREIGEHEKIDVKYLQLIGSLYFIFECLSSFVFGILCDYIRLKYLLLFINVVGTFVGYTYCFTFENGLIFFLVQNFLSFSAGGYYPVKDCFLMQVYGNDIYIELSGFVSFFVALVVNVITPITYMVISSYEQKETAYWILFLSFGSLNLIGTILNCFLDESPLNLEQLIKEKNKKDYKV